MSRPVGVALLGLGTVGSAVARAMGERAKGLEATAGGPLRLVGACVRDASKARNAGDVAVTTDPFELLDDENVDIVVEVMGGTDPALDLHLAAFERGKHIVTANKELVAREWRQLHEAATNAKRTLRFEAAVGGGIPIVAAVRGLGAARPRQVRGLLNGTTTYICSRVEAGATFDAALAEAQAKGYAEADPSADIDGWDPAYKLSILASLLEGHWQDPERVLRTAMRGLSLQHAHDAAGSAARVRYLATADFGERGVEMRVELENVPAESLEGQATGATNVIRVDTDLTGPMAFVGPGAGGEATATSILGDVIWIARAMR